MKINSVRSRITYTVATILLLCIVLMFVTAYIYQDAEDECFESLHVHTAQIKENLDLQMLSDRENLVTMANFAGNLYSRGESFDLLFDSFETIGLIENVGLLMPDGRFMTKMGTLKLNGTVDFHEEAKKGIYISGREKDFTNSSRQVIRTAVPVVSEGKTIAILYGVIGFKSLEEKYGSFAEAQNAQLFVIDRSNGDILLDTWNSKAENLLALSDRERKKEYSYEKMQNEIMNAESGFSSFRSKITQEYLYAHYAPTQIENWQIMLCQPEKIVFSEARKVINILFAGFAIIILIMSAYLWLFYRVENKRARIHSSASEIRKLLLQVNQRFGSIREALILISQTVKSRSAIFVNSDGEDFNYISPAYEKQLLSKDDRKYFVEEMFRVAKEIERGSSVKLEIVSFIADKKMKKQSPQFYNFLIEHKIRKVIFAVLINRKKNISILGVINPHKVEKSKELLKDIGICFEMAIDNKRYLSKTEHMAVTDSMTGLMNHMAYMHDIKSFNSKREGLVCVYIDVNELHYVNNRYGHAAGDKMLTYIADALAEEFREGHIYRIGGDEFVLFVEESTVSSVEDRMKWVTGKIKEKDYHISVGIAGDDSSQSAEMLVKAAEHSMYKDKAKYYRRRENIKLAAEPKTQFNYISTGLQMIDECIKVMSARYSGLCYVSIKDDSATNILSPRQIAESLEAEGVFSDSFARYVREMVSQEDQRVLMDLLNYNMLRNQLKNSGCVSVVYTKVDGEESLLTVYAVSQQQTIENTLWVFEKKD